MGQYYKAVNLTKKEVVNAWDLGGVAKFVEWLYNDWARIFVWLLAKSEQKKGSGFTRLGGGDIDNQNYTTLGRWAGDKIVLVGDYDESKLYDKADKYNDISITLKEEYNRALQADGMEEYQLDKKKDAEMRPDMVLTAK